MCAAVTDVDKCFRAPAFSEAINVVNTIEVFKLAKKHRVIPIFFSSDYVFAPRRVPYLETDERNPSTQYGRQKLAVEKYLEENFENYLIFRTSKLMSEFSHKKNIISQIVEPLKRSQGVHCFDDQWITPVSVEDASRAVGICCKENLTGVFHLGTKQILSRFEIGKIIATKFDFDPSLVQVSKIANSNPSEPRPNYHLLNSQKIKSTIGIQFTEFETVIDRFKNNFELNSL